MVDGGRWSRKNESIIIEIRNDLIESLFAYKDMTVIVDDTNLCPKHEAVLRTIAEIEEAEFEVKDFTDVPLEECIKRDSLRANPVGKNVIMRMYNQYLRTEEGVEPDPTLDRVYLCDIDGTLAIHDGRSPYDESRVKEDLPNKPVAETIESLLNYGYKIIFISGRHEDCREDTREWLQNVVNIGTIQDSQLLMRSSGDNRKDSIVKRELFDNYVRDKYNVVGVFDDRDQVVKMWRSLGLTCFQVAEGNF